jgi:galactose mutarotase-like enzyme
MCCIVSVQSSTPRPVPSGRRSVELRSPSGLLEATFVPGAGMLGWSLRHAGEELLGHPVSLETYVETGEPTGVPLLHPWANRLASPEYEIAGRRVRLDRRAPNVHTDPRGLPIHGLVAGSPRWEVVEEAPSGLEARLAFAAWPELAAGFPFPHVLALAAGLSNERLEIDAQLIPTSDSPVPVAFGFHPYLRLPGLERESWVVDLPVTSRMRLDDRMLPTGESEPVRIPPGPLGRRVFDDAFDGLAGHPPEFVLSGAGRRVSVRFLEGYRFAQVYAPAGSDFIAFEPMTAPVNAFESDRTLLAQPGSTYRARFDIAVAGGEPG